MTRLVLASVVRSQRIVGPLLATFVAILFLTAQGGQTPGAALSGIALLLIPVHVWIGFTTGRAMDEPTLEVTRVALGRRCVAIGTLLAAAALCGAATVLTTSAVVALRVMKHFPTAPQWASAVAASAAGVSLGVAVGLGSRWAWRERGGQVLGLAAAGLGLGLLPPIATISRAFDRGAADWAATGRIALASAACVGTAAVGLAIAAWRQATRPD